MRLGLFKVSPMTEYSIPHFPKIFFIFSRFDGSIARNILSCDSLTHISHGSILLSFKSTLSRFIIPDMPPAKSISLTALESPPPPRSFIPSIISASFASRMACISGSFIIGFPSCTAFLFSSLSALRILEAKFTPCIPSLPVLPPHTISRSPSLLILLLTTWSFLTMPMHPAFTRGMPLYMGLKFTEPATVGMPTRFP
ncbi:MAG: hypothetical protein AMDU4_FER2C00169G0002 [Ferroplasma sp. Type II]|nr:MAG: hypothetical protein AMDU4_FER2C00169G0002 [Ferroplasma sp. Type II]